MTLTRVLTAAVLIPAVVAVVLWGSTGLVAAAAGLVTVVALLDFFALVERVDMHGYRLWTCFCALVLLFHQWRGSLLESWSIGEGGLVIRNPSGVLGPWFLGLDAVVLLFVFGTVTLAVTSRRALSEALPSMSVSAAALLFVALPLSFVVRLHGVRFEGPKLLLFMLVSAWVGDTLAYFVGRTVGRLPMASEISPKKTWEGGAANLLGSLLVAVVFRPWLSIEPRHLLIMAVLGNLAGQAGDLFESAYKRSAGAKDSGTLLPGHGGMLDRIDALILSSPAGWYYFDLFISRRG